MVEGTEEVGALALEQCAQRGGLRAAEGLPNGQHALRPVHDLCGSPSESSEDLELGQLP